MATTWGQFSWGSNSWQSNQNNITPSSSSLSADLGTVDAESSVGWGAKSWSAGEWGTLANSIVLQGGISLSANIGTVTVTSEINIGWGGLAWNEGEWGDLANPNIDLTGQALTISQGEELITADANVSVTGIESNFTVQGVVAGTSVLFETGSVSLAISETSVFAGELVVVPVTSPSNDEWGTEYWGAGMWGVGDGITVLLGTETEHVADGNVQVSGNSLTTSLGTVEIPVIIDSGIEITSNIGSAFGGPVIEVQVTTASAQPWGETAWGDGQWGQSVGTDIGIGGEEVAVPSVEVDVTGISITSNTGQESVSGDANVPVTSAGLLTTTLGDEDAFTNVRINITGFSVGTIVIGDFLAGISDTAEPTGMTMTSTTGTIGLNAWELVDPGSSPTWTVVDKAA